MNFRNLYLFNCAWEKVSPRDLDHCDWPELDSMPENYTINFLNHSNGPFYTSLIEPEFPQKLSTFARHFIKRFPWIEHFSPIVDIQLTAENCFRNGTWSPYLESELYYFKALLNQCKASILAMREIRYVVPQASFIQYEDISNKEIGLSALDLLLGKITRNHSLYYQMLEHGIQDSEIMWFQDNQIKINYLQLKDICQDSFLTWKRYHIPTFHTSTHMEQMI